MRTKKLVSIFLCLTIFLNVYPLAYAATVSQKPDSIPDTDVFLKYPEFLVCQAADDVTNKSADQCFAILSTRTSANNIAAVAVTLWKDATSITVNEVAAKLGWKSSYEEKILRSATEKLLSSLPDTAEISIDAANKTSEILKKSGAVLKALKKSEDLSGCISKMFSDMGISDAQKKADDFCATTLKRFSSVIKGGSKVIDTYKAVIAMFTLYCYRWETVNTLLEYVDDSSDLHKGLMLVKNDMLDPNKYVLRHFAQKPILKKISGWASKKVDALLASALGISEPMSAVLDLVKTLYLDYIYDGYTVDQYAEAVYLLGFSQSIESSIRNLQKKFAAHNGTSDDITSYGELYGAWIAAQMASLQECSDLVDILKQYDLKTDALQHRSYLEQIYNYSFYLHLCKKNIVAAIDNGQIKQTTNTQTSNNTQTISAEKTSKPLPTNFSVSTNKITYILGEPVTITPSANNATNYAISIWRGAFNTGDLLYENYNLPGGITFTPPSEGSYTIRADAKNAAGYISLEKTFTVTKENTNDLPTTEKDVSPLTDTYYTVRNMGSQKMLNVVSNSSKSGTNITVYQADGTTGQNFMFIPDGTGGYVLQPQCAPDCALNIYGQYAAEGFNITTWTKSGHSTQSWKIEREDTWGGCVIRSMNDPDYVVTATGTKNASNVQIQRYDPSNPFQVWTSSAF